MADGLFWLAAVACWMTVLRFVPVELTAGLIVRGNLTLNGIMLVYSLAVIRD
ncbi:DUF2585 family protein [Pseudovibrio japonicus]|uniref:DUF2585 family protein n=1 Tax=Pseudovibrio japonicus TaxID=366534 RepID=UPI00353111CF